MHPSQQASQHAMYMQPTRGVPPPQVSYVYAAAPNMGKNIGNGQALGNTPIFMMNMPQPGQPQSSAQPQGYAMQPTPTFMYPMATGHAAAGNDAKGYQVQLPVRNVVQPDGSGAPQMYPQNVIFQQPQHMSQQPRQMPTSMLLQGQPMTMNTQMMPQYGGQPRQTHHYNGQPSSNNFNVGGTQQQYFQPTPSQMYYPNQASGQPAPNNQPVTLKRERKALAIVNPDTGKDVVVETASTPSSSGAVEPPKEPTPPPETMTAVAAQFAAQVAATLNPPSSASQSRSISSVDEPKHQISSSDGQPTVKLSYASAASVPQHPPGAPQNLARNTTSRDQPTTDTSSIAIPTTQPAAASQKPVSQGPTGEPLPAQALPQRMPKSASPEQVAPNVPQAPLPVVDKSQDTTLKTTIHSVPTTFSEQAPADEADRQKKEKTPESITKSNPTPIVAKTAPLSFAGAVAKTDHTPATPNVGPRGKENKQQVESKPAQQIQLPKQQPERTQMSYAQQAAATPKPPPPAASITKEETNGKKKKKKDFKGKGKAHGSDMDAFIDESTSSTEKEASKPTSDSTDGDSRKSSITEIESHLHTSVMSSEREMSPVVNDTTSIKLDIDIKEQPTAPTDNIEESSTAPMSKEPPVSLPESSAPISTELLVTKTSIDDTPLTSSVTTEVILEKTPPISVKPEVSVTGNTSDKITPSSAAPTDSSSFAVDSETFLEVTKPPVVITPQQDNMSPTVTEVTSTTTVDSKGVDDVKIVDSGRGSEEKAGVESGSHTTPKPPLLKYQYSEDQWSPLNPEGKKQYDRNFILQLQYASTSTTKPTGLPSLPDIILNEPRTRADPHRQNSLDHSHNFQSTPDFTPGFIKSSPSGGGGRGPPRRGGSVKRGDQQRGGGPSAEQHRKVINHSLVQDVQLRTTENAWKPGFAKKEDPEGDKVSEELFKKVRGILNKLTPQKFQTLIQQVHDLTIDTEARLKGCIDIIFEKAISEPNFSVAYANMAKCMLNLNVPTQTNPAEMVSFRKLLLNRCQQEFEKDKEEELDIAERQRLVDEATSEEKKKELTEAKELAFSKAKRRSLGNIRFIGELFKLKMLTEKIMHDCLTKLLKSSDDEDSIECLCQLFTTIGLDIDHAKSKPLVDKYFSELSDLVAKKKTSARIRFMLQDLIDMRSNDWVKRRQDNNPKTIEQIHKEAKDEEQQKKIQMMNAPPPENRGRRGGAGGGRGSMGGPNQGEDGWTSVSSRQPPRNIVDPSRMKLTKQQVDENSIQLGPGGRPGSTGLSWHRGSSGGGVKTPTQDTERPVSNTNRYSALTMSASESLDARNRSGSRGGAGSGGGGSGGARDYRGRMSGPQRAPISRSSQERSTADSATRSSSGRGSYQSPAGSRSASRESRDSKPVVVDRTPDQTTPTAAVSKTSDIELSEADIEKKTKSLVEEYLHGHDVKEATLCVRELGSAKSLHLFIYHSLLQNLEKSTHGRQLTGALHYHLVKLGVISSEQYADGLRMILDFAEDMIIDIPRIWEYLGELISPMAQDSNMSLSFLRPACQPLIKCNKAGKLVAMVLHDAAHRLGHHKVADLWRQSGLKWTDFVAEVEVQEFLAENKLEFTEEEKPMSPVNTSLFTEQMQRELDRLLDSSETPKKKKVPTATLR